MRREVAKKQTQRAQIAAIVLLAVAGGVLVMPSLFVSRASEPETSPAAPKVALSKVTTTAELTTAALSQQDISEILEGIRPPAPPVSQVEATPVTPDQPVQPPVAEAPWRYIGVILGPSREAHRAIVTVGDSQRMLSEGEQVDQDRVDEITSDYLLVTGTGGAQRKIDMAARKRLDLVITPGGTGDEMNGVAAGSQPLTAEEQNKLDNAARLVLKDPATTAYVRSSKAELQGRELTDANVLGAQGEKIIRAMNRSGTVAPGSNSRSGGDGDGSMLNSALGLRLAQLRRLRDTGQLTAAEYAQRAAEANAAANDQLPPTNPPPPPPAPAPVNPNGAGGGTTTTGSR